MIGFYDYTVILTYLSLACSVFGMTRVLEGHFTMAIVCLAISGLLDMFDGKVARTKKNRTDDEKLFVVQIDSLCDVVCFGVFPSVICYAINERSVLCMIAICYFSICGVIRLAYFNVLETNRQREEEGANRYYRGLPITSIAVILPFVSLMCAVLQRGDFGVLLMGTLIVTGTLFILNFRFKKPSNSMLIVLVAVTAAAVVTLILFKYFKVSRITTVELLKLWFR